MLETLLGGRTFGYGAMKAGKGPKVAPSSEGDDLRRVTDDGQASRASEVKWRKGSASGDTTGR